MLAFLLSLFLLFPQTVHAIYDPLSVPNNKYGMHITDFSDIADVATLVNSTGGDWGYITLVASDNDRDSGKWQRYFDQMRRLHLIPLVRIATHVEKNHWVKPDTGKFDEIVSFFDALNWPTENRYVILYNEPNHAKEWGSEIDPEGYAHTFVDLAHKFKAASEDFFILPAGLDVSATSDSLSLDAREYLRRMISAEPSFLTLIDGWTSHSYPNPGFSGSPFATGRGTLRSFDWELSYLSSLGLKKQLPVFITETGWISSAIGTNLKIAGSGAWKDPRIVAITPFVFNYQAPPFDIFSWKRLSSVGGYYPQYDQYKEIKKISGAPPQRETYILSDPILPLALVSNGSYTLSTQITNIGQGILTDADYDLVLEGDTSSFMMLAGPLPTLEPGEKGELGIHLKAPAVIKNYRVVLSLKHHDLMIPLQTQDVRVVPPPSLTVRATLGWRRQSEATDVTVLVYDEGKLLHKFTGFSLKNGEVRVDGLTNILPGHPYRVVVLVPYYLPQQAILPLKATQTLVTMKRLLPLDFNRDGKLDPGDIVTAFSKQPNDILKLFVGP